MIRKNKIVTIFGGTGFLGRQLVRELARRGMTIKVATRVPERAYFLRPCGVVGQVVPVAVDYNDAASIEAAVAGSDLAVNCIGILFQKRKGGFERAHVTTARVIAEACKRHGVSRMVHISALGIEDNISEYARTKREGEAAVEKAFPAVTILRPSVMFGPDDDFFNKFAEMARYAPALPLIGGGHTKFQPVYVCDVAAAAVNALLRSDLGPDSPCGQIYELGGPQVLDFREIYQKLFALTGRKRRLVNLPWGAARLLARFMSLLPQPPLTPDQVDSLKSDTILTGTLPGLAALDVSPSAMDLILPSYLEGYQAGGRFGSRQPA